MEAGLFEPDSMCTPDPEIDAVVAELRRLDPDGDRFAAVIRDTFDQIYDGQRTGRWSFDQLFKTERTHIGTLVEINLQREFKFADGDETDYRIAGIQVDCKYSMEYGKWMLPPEVMDRLALVVTANDEHSTWQAGVVRARREWVNNGNNRDAKKTLKAAHRSEIRNLWPHHPGLKPNLFYSLPEADRKAIFDAKSARGGTQHGQARVNELFRRAQGRIVRRAELATVAQQDDFMKRGRSNGGARDKLRPEGILVLGHQDDDPVVAASLGLPVPKKGELVSSRVARAGPSDPQVAEVGGSLWRIATASDPVGPAPVVTR
ncbi:NaeI family type II restriction endonuclease [Tsukamurella tyrosinosolvens]|uniref:NaeI family type II restriction endonuclease n=1 Tax=Tsukamurella tyrosinosolvens TaxID=57704 RepID=UPI0021636C3F|nr:NaeI family type II restriction endonuclease [Tsukamurella tyrosinosolvens]